MKRRIDPFWSRMAVLAASVAALFWGLERLPVLVNLAVLVVIFVVAGKLVYQGWVDSLSGERDKSESEK